VPDCATSGLGVHQLKTKIKRGSFSASEKDYKKREAFLPLKKITTLLTSV
jgi:hypothetical protein